MYEYFHENSGKKVTLRPFKLDQDLEKLFRWLHEPHVIPQWKMNQPKPMLYEYFKKALAVPEQQLWMVTIDDQEIGYAETYAAVHDRIHQFCEVDAGDYGLHLLIGDPAAIGKKLSEPFLAALTDYLFHHKKARRVLVEPDHRVRQLDILEKKLGFKNLGFLQLPEKKATLYAALPQDFYFTTTSQEIKCDTSAFPIIYLHFPSYPKDEIVYAWLNAMEELLDRAMPGVVISTFAANYQFSSDARRAQALWFKKNKKRLANLCLGMVRVTKDKNLIQKITSAAMRKGMPFICIPVATLFDAKNVALGLLAQFRNTSIHE